MALQSAADRPRPDALNAKAPAEQSSKRGPIRGTIEETCAALNPLATTKALLPILFGNDGDRR